MFKLKLKFEIEMDNKRRREEQYISERRMTTIFTVQSSDARFNMVNSVVAAIGTGAVPKRRAFKLNLNKYPD